MLRVAAATLCRTVVGARKPLICRYRAGIVVDIIGATCPDALPLVPKWVRFAWTVLAMRGFPARVLGHTVRVP